MLPIDSLLPELQGCLREHCLVLLQAPPGAGKTSAVAPALLSAEWRRGRRIALLEPRRLAARRAAEWMASQMGQRPGETVGLCTRLETRLSAATEIEVMTEGILIRRLQRDPELSDYAAVLFDEFHERSLPADLGLALVRETIGALREDLRVLVMSATLDTEQLRPALGNPPLLVSEGRSFPVTTHFRPPSPAQDLCHHTADVVAQALQSESGSVLVFLPGMAEINRVERVLSNRLPDDVLLHRLHGQDDARRQQAAVAKPKPRQRKVVLASAVAESSLTIDGVRVVVDAGLERYSAFDPNTGMERLGTRRLSRASADQRRGRAGRTEPGVCFRLWSEDEDRRLPAFAPPAIRQADLAPAVMELAQWGAREPDAVPWLEEPPAAHWQQACDLLRALGVLDEHGGLSPAGQKVLELGLHPRLGVLVMEGRRLGLAETAARTAALLSDRDPLAAQADSQLWARLRWLEQSRSMPASLKQAIARLWAGADQRRADATDLGELLVSAYPDRIARRRPGGEARFQLSNGRGAVLDASDGLAQSPWLLAVQLDGAGRDAKIRLAVPLAESTIDALAETRGRQRTRSEWDERRGCVVVRQQRCLGELVLSEQVKRADDPEQCQAGLLAEIRRRGLGLLAMTDAEQQWLARVALLHRTDPAHWPNPDESDLLARLDDWLGPFLVGVTDLKGLQAMALQPALDYWLGAQRQAQLDRLAPTHWRLPTGQRAVIDYCQGEQPVLATKLQTLLGCEQGPFVADGQVAVVLHLLSPAQRPLAVTSDLASFWRNAYPDVRRDMRGRYPKHPWPEDPLSASAQAGTKRRG